MGDRVSRLMLGERGEGAAERMRKFERASLRVRPRRQSVRLWAQR